MEEKNKNYRGGGGCSVRRIPRKEGPIGGGLPVGKKAEIKVIEKDD